MAVYHSAGDAAVTATSYNVKRATSEGGTYTTIGSPAGTSFNDTGLTNGTTYYYVVSAVNGFGESADSAEVDATPELITTVTVPPDSPLIPDGFGYGIGDTFQLVFVTSTATNMSDLETTYGAPRTMATFNSYVNDVADGSSIAGIPDLNWSVIASTNTVDARDNALVIGPVHRLNDDAIVADNFADMWDGSLDNLINADENGNAPSNWQVWSGTGTDGAVFGSNGLDQSSTRYASSDGNWNDPSFNGQGQVAADSNWIDLTGIAVADNRVYRFYALSEPITIAAAGQTLSEWLSGYTGVGAMTGLNQDPDGDGNDNGEENYFGTHPGETSRGLVSGMVDTEANTFTFTHPLNSTPATDLTVTYIWSKDLSTFYTDGHGDGSTTVTFSDPNASGGIATVTATITGTVIPDRLFVDVHVTQP
jgi:hypothetical protein